MLGLMLFEDLTFALDYGKLKTRDVVGQQIAVEFKLSPPATIEAINKTESLLGIRLPSSYKEFLLKYNGGRVFDYDGLDGFIIYGTDNITKAYKQIALSYQEDWIDTILVFAECIGEGNYLAFDCRFETDYEFPVLDGFHEKLPCMWSQISPSFDTWLKQIVQCSGKKFWLVSE